MNAVPTAKTLITIESLDWKHAIDGRDYTYACPNHVALAVALGFNGKQYPEQISDDKFSCSVCDGELVKSMREWLSDAFDSDEIALEEIKESTAEQVINYVKHHYHGGVDAFVLSSVPQ